MAKENTTTSAPAPVAIIGVGCRLPGGANSLDQLEHLLNNGNSGWGPIPATRWNRSAFYNPRVGTGGGARESLPACSGYFLAEDVSKFDARFFEMTPRDAHGADPQQRLLLQTTYEALENAGVPLEQVRGSDTSVYVSIFAQDYYRMGFKELQVLEGSHVTGTGPAMLSNKISYVFDLNGASLTLDTGCSGSLVAMHQACQGLRLGESKMAIVGGSQLSLHPDQSVNMAGLGMVNPDGHCYAFDSRGNGYARGEGVATVLLKLLDQAIADGDNVHAVIVNSGINQDGRTAGSIMSPSGDAQAALIKSVYATAGLDPGQTPYVEAHGTGTQVGDKEEVGAIFRVFCEGKDRSHDLAVGSVKANIGHLEASAGIAGVLKSIVVLRSGLVPPQLNLVKPKPQLRLHERNIHIPLELTPLAAGPQRASINSFGYGGSNAHVIVETLESYVSKDRIDGQHKTNGLNKTNGHSNGHANGFAKAIGVHDTGSIVNGQTNGHHLTNGKHNGNGQANNHRGNSGLHKDQGQMDLDTGSNGTVANQTSQLFLVTANSEVSLKLSAENISTWVTSTAAVTKSKGKQAESQLLTDLAYTLSARRSLLPWRCSVVASNLEQLVEGISTKAKTAKKVPTADRTPRLAFVFTGQGAQWVGMGRELMTIPAFAKSINRSTVYLVSLGCDWCLKGEMLSSSASSRLKEAEIAQPATTALQIALVDLLLSLNIKPSSVVGHSSGEIAAAYAAGYLDHETAVKVAYNRGVQSAHAVKRGIMSGIRGSMLATGLGEDDIEPYIAQISLEKGKISVACVNSPQSTTISGDEAAIEELKALLDAKSVFARKLRVDTAYHSHHMVPVASAYLEAMGDIEAKESASSDNASRPLFYSSVTGNQQGDGLGPDSPKYWAKNLVSKVRFSDAMKSLVQTNTGHADATGFTFIELGPAAALAGPAKQTLSAAGVKNSTYLSVLVRETDARVSALTLLGHLVELGHGVKASKTGPLLEEASEDGNQQHKLVANLKPYPFDEASYWRESRLSSAHRFRPFAYHDLCGLLDPGSSIQEPRWTHHLQVASLPWLRDHVVDDSVIFPASGSICMVFEAMRQLVQMRTSGITEANVPNFSVSDVVFSKAICLPIDDDKAEVELQLTISPSQEAGGRWETFRIVSYTKNGDGQGGGIWEENCSGLISCDVDIGAASANGGEQIFIGASEYERKLQGCVRKLEEVQEVTNAARPMDSDAFYGRLSASGNHYGAEFALLRDICVAEDVAWAKVTVPVVAQPHHLVHPTMLDAICHMGALMFKGHCGQAPIVVGSIPNMTVLAAGQDQLRLLSAQGTELLVAGALETQDSRSCITDVWVLYKDDENGILVPLLKSKYVLRAYGSGALAAKSDSEDGNQKTTGYDGHKAHRMVWKADAGVASNVLTRQTTTKDDAAVDGHLNAIELAASICISRTLAEIESANTGANHRIDVTMPHLKKLLDWMSRYVNSDTYRTRTAHLHTAEDESRAVETAENSSEGPQGKMVARIGRVLTSVLAGKTEPLGVMMEGDLLGEVYGQGRLMQASYTQMEEYLSLLAFKHPQMKLLEIGAGTGGATLPALRAMSSGGEDGDVWLESYDYTDVSAGFFEQAKDKFARWAGSDLMRFGVLEVERDPGLQGYTAHSYDIVLAVNVLHATKDMHATMTNVRKLLKPGGKLVLVELTSLTVWTNMIFGTLPGWWAFEDDHLRKDCPLLRTDQWDDVLRNTGFSGVDVVSHNSRTPGMGVSSMMVASAVDLAPEPEIGLMPARLKPLDHVKIIKGFAGSPALKAVADGLRIASVSKGHESWDSLEPGGLKTTTGDECLVVLDVADNSLLLSKNQDTFETVKQLLTAGADVMWVALQDHADSDGADGAKTKGYRAMIQGLARVLRRENGTACRLITVDVHGTTDLRDQTVIDKICSRLIEVAEASLVLTSSSLEDAAVSDEVFYEREYALRDGQVLIPRLQTDDSFLAWADCQRTANTDGDKASSASVKLEKNVLFHQVSRPLRLQVAVPGLLSSLRFVDDDIVPHDGTLQPWEIQVSSRAHGINFKDIFVALGQMKAGVTMVGELAGIVTAVGSDMKSRYQPGDHVMGFGSPSHFASDPVLSGHLAYPMPANLSFAEAASIPVIYATAHHCLFAVARFRAGRTILVTAASGGVGQAAIQLAQYAGAGRGDIFVVVGSAAKRRLVVETYGIPETHVLSSRSRGADLRDAVLRLTGGRGVDVVLNSLSGDMLTAGLECVAPLGAFVEIGKTDIYKGSHIRMGDFDRSVTFTSVDLIVIAAEQPDTVYETLGAVADLLAKGHVRPPFPVTELPISKIDEAFRMIASRKHTGKVVLTSEPEETVMAVASKPATFQLAQDGTYVIAGGLGDLGRRFAVFLASRGAGNIVLLSRRDISDDDRATLEKTVNHANARGVTRLHIVKCDITVASDMQGCVEYCRKESLLPVRGIIHGGMVLKDRPFVHMNHDDFTTVLGPKVDGTINLDQALGSSELDFFITLSSTTTQVGNGSQGAYASGNSFQDAFARARSGGKTHYMTLNLGGITGSAWVEKATQSNRLSSIAMSFDDLLSSLEYAMHPAGARRDACSQSILGLCRKSLEDADDAVSLSNPLFSRLPYQKVSNTAAAAAAKTGTKIDTEQSVRSAETTAAAQAVIQEAILAKCAVFLDRPIEELPSNAPLATIGLDSLVSIELKNWILRVFQATVQTSEISSALSIASLAATVTSRSKLISAETRASGNNDKDVSELVVANGSAPTTNGNATAALPAHGFQCCKAAKDLPKYPLPDLKTALKSLVANVSHFSNSAEELEGLRKAVAEFSAPGSLGQGLYEQLAVRAADPSLDSWLADLHLKGLYLTRRHPVAPWGNFLSTHRDTPQAHGQADRAAIIAGEAFRFLLEVENDQLDPDWLGTQPLCSNSWKWMFNAVREPRVGCDEMMRYPGPEYHYCVVLRRGHVFTVPLLYGDGEQQPVSHRDLQAAFQEIIDGDSGNEDSWAGLLTSDFRDPWATNRTELLSLGASNEAYIQAVERAAFVMCLDTGKPETNEERVRQAYVGNGFNRWFDKSTQFIVSANGRSAQLMEHSPVDGLTIIRLTERIHDAIQSHVPMSNGSTVTNGLTHANGKGSSSVKITPFALQTTPKIEEQILKLRATYLEATNMQKYALHTIPSLGIATALGTGFSAKACVDMAIQLANRIHFGGQNPGSWEPVSTQHFHRGRPELVQVVTDSVVTFCSAATSVDLNQKQQLVEAKELLKTAVDGWEQSIKEASQGGGFLRLWDTLQGMLPVGMEDKDKPAIFTDPVFWRAFPGKVLQVRNEAEVEDAAICVWQEGGLWMSYSIREQGIAVSIIGGKGKVEEYQKCLDKAGVIVRAIVRA